MLSDKSMANLLMQSHSHRLIRPKSLREQSPNRFAISVEEFIRIEAIHYRIR
jgi:hypothetical protein